MTGEKINPSDSEAANKAAAARVDKWKLNETQEASAVQNTDTSASGDAEVPLLKDEELVDLNLEYKIPEPLGPKDAEPLLPDWKKAELADPIEEGPTYWTGVRLLTHPENPDTPFDQRVQNLEDYINGLTDLANDDESEISHTRRGLQGQEGSHTDGLPTTEAKLDKLKEAYYTEGKITDPTVQKQAAKVIEFWQDKKALSEGLKSGKIFQATAEVLCVDVELGKEYLLSGLITSHLPNMGQDMSDDDLRQILTDESADERTKKNAQSVLNQRQTIREEEATLVSLADYCKNNYPDLGLSDYLSTDNSEAGSQDVDSKDDAPKDISQDTPQDTPQDIEPKDNSTKDVPRDTPKDDSQDVDNGQDNDHDKDQDGGQDSENQTTREKIEELYVEALKTKAAIDEHIKELETLLGIAKDDQDDGGDQDRDDDGGQDDEPGDQDAEPNPKLVAVNVDLSAEIRSEAKRLAEDSLNAEIAQKGLLTRIFKGGLLNRYYKEKYRQEILSGERKVSDGQDGQMTLAEYITSKRGAAQAARIAAGTVDAVHFLHEGEQEHLRENTEETQLVKDAIQAYVEAVNNGTDRATALNAFREKVYANRIEAQRNGQSIDNQKYQNYETVAEQALELAEHYGGIESVLEGFKVYDAEASYAVNTKEHNTRVDRAVEWLEKRGLMVPAQIVAGGTGIVSSLVTSGSKALFGVGVGVGAGTVLAGIKAYNKTTQDRASAFYNNAVGREYVDSSTPPTEVHGIRNRLNARQANKRANYERKIMDTNYDIVRANDLATQLKEARESGNREALLNLTTDIRARQAMSERYGVDFIGYSSPDRVGDEDLNLRIEQLQADQALAKMPPEGNHLSGAEEQRVAQDVLARELSDAMTNRIAILTENMQTQDERFSGFRRGVTFKASAKYGLGTIAAMFISDEFKGWLSNDHRSVTATLAGADANDRPDAEQSILHKAFFGDRQYIAEQHIVNPNSNPNEVNRLRQEGGWQETQGPDKTVERTVNRTTSMNNSPYRTGAKNVWLDNDTPEYDLGEQELIGDGKHGLTIAARGVASHGGIQHNIGDELRQGNVVGTITDRQGNTLLTPAISDGAGGWRLGDSNGIYQIMDPTTGKIVGQTDLSNATAYVSGAVLKRNASGAIEELHRFDTEPLHGDLDIPTINASETVFDTVPGDITFTKWATAGTDVGIPFFPIMSNNNLGTTRPIAQTTPPPTGTQGGGQPSQPGGQQGTPRTDDQPGGTPGNQPDAPQPGQTPDRPNGPDEDQPTGTQEGNPVPTPDQGTTPSPDQGNQGDQADQGTQPAPQSTDNADATNANPNTRTLESIHNSIQEHRDLIGGEIGQRLIMDSNSVSRDNLNPDDADGDFENRLNTQYDGWFNLLSEEGRNYVRDLARELRLAGPSVANSFSANFINWANRHQIGTS